MRNTGVARPQTRSAHCVAIRVDGAETQRSARVAIASDNAAHQADFVGALDIQQTSSDRTSSSSRRLAHINRSRVCGVRICECHHCKQWIEQGEAHNSWTTTEAALIRDLPEDLREAWERLRETAAGFGQQRIYASGHAIMFARKTCYFFVRPKRMFLEVCVFLGRTVKASQVRRVYRVSKSKLVHIIRITHRDEAEAPVTDWLHEAYEVSEALSKGDAALKTNKRLSGT